MKEYIGEKGVDIALAVKMIALSVEKKCDKIILISGDYDYTEAIRFVKNNMTKIHIVKFHKGFPPKNKNMSRDLSVLADKVLDVFESDLQTNFLKNK
ncbi:MAG: NYN domain-containing protein [Cytophagales bacterium]|nr:NYN domain-containing protein [Cytophagales bacterium]